MKRLAGILGVLGGIGAILWAMRDRLVSVAIPREPQPPALRVPERPTRRPGTVAAEDGDRAAETEEETTSPSITDVSGIGPVYATRLEAAGIATLADLADSEAEKVAEAAQVTVSRARGWVESAQELTSA